MSETDDWVVPHESASAAPAQSAHADDWFVPDTGHSPALEPKHLQQGTSPFATGLVEPGNVELWDRPVLHNPDGSYSTTHSLSFDEGSKEVLIPTVVDGKQLTPTDAIRRYRQTGEHLGKFATADAADRYAETLHQAQAARYDQNGNPLSAPETEIDQAIEDAQRVAGVSKAPRISEILKVGSPAENWSNIGEENLDDAGIRKAQPPAGVFRNFAAGTVDAATGALEFFSDPGAAEEVNALGLQNSFVPQGPPGTGQHAANELLGHIGLNPETVPVNSDTERLARAAGFGAATVAAPELASRDAPGFFQSLYRIKKAAFTGAGSGVGGEVAADVAPEEWKPAAKIAGTLVGGGLAAGVAALPEVAAAGARGAVITQADGERMAGRRIADSATDLAAAKEALDQPSEIVPGSKPTTFQQTGDMGLGALEREVQTKNPAAFQQRRADQNSARLDQLNSLQRDGSPADLPDYIRGQMRWLDAQTDQDVTNATRVAQERADALGGAQPPEHYGVNLRVAAQKAADTARSRERALWRAVDPHGDLTINAAPIQSAAQDVLRSISGSAKPPAGDEQAILAIANSYNPTVPFRDVGDLRSWVSDAMRAELRTNGQTQTYGRLTRLRGAIEGAINGAIDGQAQHIAQTAGADAAAAWGEGIRRQFDGWQAARRSSQGDTGAIASFGTGGVSSTPGTQSQSRGRFGNTPSDQGISGAPTFNADAAERLRLATAATRDRADTFGRGPVGQVLAKAGRQDQYRTSDATVPAKIFQPGPTGFESVQAYRGAVGDPQAMLTLQDYAASSLRQFAGKTDGTLDPTKVQSWTQRHADALRAFPDLANRFRDAATASDAIGDAMAARRTALDAFQTGVFAKIVGVSNPEDVTRAIGGILNSRNSVHQMQQLAMTARRDPSAMAGLRKGVVDYLQSRFV